MRTGENSENSEDSEGGEGGMQLRPTELDPPAGAVILSFLNFGLVDCHLADHRGCQISLDLIGRQTATEQIHELGHGCFDGDVVA